MPVILGLRLQSGVLKGINIPDEQQEADRLFFRHRKRIWKDSSAAAKTVLKACLLLVVLTFLSNTIMPTGVLAQRAIAD